MRGAQQRHLGTWETDGQGVAALADLGRRNPQPVVEKAEKPFDAYAAGASKHAGVGGTE